MKLCPICKSTNLILDTAAHTGKWKCKDCGYLGALVIEETKEP